MIDRRNYRVGMVYAHLSFHGWGSEFDCWVHVGSPCVNLYDSSHFRAAGSKAYNLIGAARTMPPQAWRARDDVIVLDGGGYWYRASIVGMQTQAPCAT